MNFWVLMILLSQPSENDTHEQLMGTHTRMCVSTSIHICLYVLLEGSIGN